MSRAATPADVIAGTARWCVVEGDALDVVRALPVACVGAVVTDPPAGIAFMGAEWDRDKGGRAQWVAWLAEVLGHARAATRDGGRALVWSLPRTSHWTGCAVEDAGWSIESTVTHLFGTGWPKGQSQLKPLAETWWLARTGRSTALNIDGCRVSGAKPSTTRGAGGQHGAFSPIPAQGRIEDDGAGRYPPNAIFSHAPGCHCVGERRVHTGDKGREWIAGRGGNTHTYGTATERLGRGHGSPDGTELVEAWECVEGCPVAELDRQSGELSARGNVSAGVAKPREWSPTGYGAGIVRDNAPHQTYDAGGGASRFFPQFLADEYALFGYHAKPSRAERDAGVSLDARPADAYAAHRHRRMEGEPERFDGAPVGRSANDHPTVKSIALMRWLVRLVTRPGDVVLDPFGGSGTTGVAALCEGRRVILVEREPRFAEIARQRCEHATPDLGVPVRVAAKSTPAVDPRQLDLFGGDP